MLKVCVCLIYKPLEMIFNPCIEPGVFPFEWNKGYIGSIHKKGDKQTLERYTVQSRRYLLLREFLKDYIL